MTAWLRITLEDGRVLSEADPFKTPPSHSDLTEAGRWCMIGAKLSPSSYLATKAFTYLFFLLKARTVLTSQKGMGALQRIILGFICAMLFSAALAVWLVGANRSQLDSTCIFVVPAWSVILMAFADAILSAVTLYLFLQPLRETIRANRELHQAQIAQMKVLSKHNSMVLSSHVAAPASPSHSHHPTGAAAAGYPSTPSHYFQSPTTPTHAQMQMQQRSSIVKGASFKNVSSPSMPAPSPRREAFVTLAPPPSGDASSAVSPTSPPPPSASPRLSASPRMSLSPRLMSPPSSFPDSSPPALPTGLSVYSSHFSALRSTQELTALSDDPDPSLVGAQNQSIDSSGAAGSLPVSPQTRPVRTTTVERMVVAPADRSSPASPTTVGFALPPSAVAATFVGAGERGFDRGHALEQVMRKNALSCLVAVLVTLVSLGEIVVASLTSDAVALKFMWLCGNFDVMVTCLAIYHLMHSSGSEKTQAQLTAGALHGQAAAMAVAAAAAASGQSTVTQQQQAQTAGTNMVTATSIAAPPDRKPSPGATGDATQRSRTTAGGALHSARSRGENDNNARASSPLTGAARKYQSQTSFTRADPLRSGAGGLTDAGPGFGIDTTDDRDPHGGISGPIPILAQHTARTAAAAAAGANGRTPRSLHKRGKSFGGAGVIGGGGDTSGAATGRAHGHRRDQSASLSEMERLGSGPSSLFSSFASGPLGSLPHRASGGGGGGGFVSGGAGLVQIGSGHMLASIADGVEPTTPSTAGAPVSAAGSARPAVSVAGAQQSSTHSSARPPMIIAVTSSSGRTGAAADSSAASAAASAAQPAMLLPGAMAEEPASELEALASGS